MDSGKLFEALEQARATERTKRQLEKEERERQRVLIQTIEEAAHYEGPEELTRFAELWAPKWWRLGEVLRTLTSVEVSSLGRFRHSCG